LGSGDANDTPGGPGPTRVLYHAVGRLRGSDVSAIAAETAYYSILAIAPFLIFLIAGVATISQFVPLGVVDDLESTVERMAPGETGELLVPLFEEARDRAGRGTTSFGMLSAMVIALWSGSRAIGALLKGFARISGVENGSPLVWGRIAALFLAIVMGVTTLLSVSVFLFGGALGRTVASWIGLGGTFSLLWTIVSWPLVAGIVLLVLAVLYWFSASSGTSQLRFFSPGAFVAMTLWLVVMAGIRVYITVVDPGSVYGVLGSFIVLVVFFYVMSLVLLIGAAVNAAVQGERAEAS
jgi:membrane protein